MNKKEFIEKLKGHGAWCTECHDTNGEKDRYVKVAKVRELLEQLDEPQKVTVPKFVAEWFEKHKHRLGYSIWKLVGESHKSYTTNKLDMRHWILQEPNNPIETLIRMKDGYEVEEEPRWIANEGDLVVRRGEHEAKVYFVESIHEDGILLVNGIKDEFFTDLDDRSVGEESINYFYENFRLLAKKENLEVEKV